MCHLTGHDMFCAPAEHVRAAIRAMAEAVHLPPQPSASADWPMRNVLSQSLQWAIMRYEKACKKAGVPTRFIVNLRQNPGYCQSFSEFIPTLLTSSSSLWSMALRRLMLPVEHLVAQGVPLFGLRMDEAGSVPPDFGIIKLVQRGGVLSDSDISLLAGNGFHLSAIRTVFVFAFGTVRRPSRMPLTAPPGALAEASAAAEGVEKDTPEDE